MEEAKEASKATAGPALAEAEEEASANMASALRSQHLVSCLSLALVSGRGVLENWRSRMSATGTTLAFLRRLMEELGRRLELPEQAAETAAFLLEARSTEPTRSQSYICRIRGLRRVAEGDAFFAGAAEPLPSATPNSGVDPPEPGSEPTARARYTLAWLVGGAKVAAPAAAGAPRSCSVGGEAWRSPAAG